MARFRFSAIIPVVFSTVAFALLIILVVAGTKPGVASDYYLLSLNTSKVGTNTIQLNAVDTTSNGGALGGLLSPLGGIINNLTSQIDSGFQNLESDIVTNVTKLIGIKDEYVIYMRNICEGDLTNQANPNSISISECPRITDVAKGLNNITSSIPSYVVIGTTNISVPALEALGNGVGNIQSILNSTTKANVAFIIIGLVSSGLVALLSLVSIVLPRVRIVSFANLFFSSLAPVVLIANAAIASILPYFIVTIVNSLGQALTINSKSGSKATAIAWISFAFAAVSHLYWFTIWFVEVRRTKFVRRRRGEEEIGKYRNTFAETRKNLRVGASEKN